MIDVNWIFCLQSLQKYWKLNNDHFCFYHRVFHYSFINGSHIIQLLIFEQ